MRQLQAGLPGKIDIPELIMEIRRRIAQQEGQPLIEKAMFAVVNNRRLFHSILRTASVTQAPFARDGFIRHLPMFLSKLTDFRSLPAIADVPFRDRIKKIDQPKSQEKVAFYSGCLIDFAYPGMGEALVKIFNKAGIEVVFPEAQTCCGAPARYSGAYEVAAQNAADNIKALTEADASYVVSACPTCTAALKYEFIKTFESLGREELISEANELSAKTMDFSSLVKKLVDEGRLAFKNARQLTKLTYHDSCHLKRTLNVFEEPRELLKKAGYEIVEMFESDICCGMGGSYSLKLPEISSPILERKLKNIRETGASVVAMDCPGCVMQIRGGFDKEGTPLSVQHTVELLAEMLEQGCRSMPECRCVPS